MKKPAFLHLLATVAGLAAALVPASARAAVGDLYEADFSSSTIFKFTPAGTTSTFASGLSGPFGLAFDGSGNLFEADYNSGTIFKFTPAGTKSTFASGLSNPAGVAFDSSGNLFEADQGSGTIFTFTPAGTKSTFASGLSGPSGLAFEPPAPGNENAAYDFNQDGKPDYVLYNAVTHQTVVWYLNNNVFVGGAFGPTLPANWRVVGVADFNADGRPDYMLFNSTTHQTAIWYLSGPNLDSGAFGQSLP